MNYITEQSQYQRELSKNQYRDFIKYIDDNYDEMYGNKVSYNIVNPPPKMIQLAKKLKIININSSKNYS